MSKNLVIVHSYHHNNTQKIAEVLAQTLSADLKEPQDVDVATLQSYELVGFGAGIDSGHHYASVLTLAESLLDANGKKAFIFSTSGIWTEKKMVKDHAALRDILLAKGYSIIGEFGCKGHDTVSFLKLFGGLNKGRPNETDLQAARDFAGRLLS
jgi:flavodoxin